MAPWSGSTGPAAAGGTGTGLAAGDVLALDMGTSSVRALVLRQGASGPLARRPVTLAVDDRGAATVDGAIYLAALVECLDELHDAGQLAGVTLVATSGQWHSVVPVTAGGTPVAPVLTWLDARPEALPGATGPADPEGFHQRTGGWWHGLYWTVRLPWLRERLGAPVDRFVGLPELVLSALLETGPARLPMSVSMASGTGLLDLAGLDWDAQACALAQVRPGELPELAPPGWSAVLSGQYAGRWPALRAARWVAPVGDGAASNIGSGCVDSSRAAVTVGTSAAVRLVQAAAAGAPLPPLPDRLWRYRVDHDRVVTGAAYSAGGNLYAWARRVLRLPDGDQLEAALAQVVPGAGVWADPRLGGDRPPGQAPPGAGSLRNIGFTTGAVHLWAGLMDGVCRMVAADLAELESIRTGPIRAGQGGQPADSSTGGTAGPVEVVLGGGAVAASPWWRRAFRTALAPRVVTDCAEPEVGAVGAARLAR